MYWLILVIAGLCEVGFIISLGKAKESTGTTAWLWYACFLFFISLSMYLLLKAIEHLPISTAYAVWTGIGAAGTALVGIFLFKEPLEFWRLFFISTLIISIIGLKVVSPNP